MEAGKSQTGMSTQCRLFWDKQRSIREVYVGSRGIGPEPVTLESTLFLGRAKHACI